MAEPAVEEWARQRQILALLVALGALVLPVSGALTYLLLTDSGDGFGTWVRPFLGASNQADVLGPVLLAGAVGLGVVASRGRALTASVSRAVAITVVVAAITQGAAFTVTAFDLIISDSYAIPGTAPWQSAKWSIFARFATEAVVCLTVVVLGMRWLDPADRKVS